MLPVAAAAPRRRRALALLTLFVLGCVLAAAVVAVGLGAVWQELYGWVLPQVAGEQLAG